MNIKKRLVYGMALLLLSSSAIPVMSQVIDSSKVRVHAVGEELSGEEAFEVMVRPFRGKLIVLDSWATWCGPCIMAMNEMKPVHAEFGHKDFEYFYVTDITSELSKWKNIVKHYPGHHFRLTSKQWDYIRDTYKIPGAPGYLIIDRDGKVVWHSFGGFPGVKTVKNAMFNALKIDVPKNEIKESETTEQYKQRMESFLKSGTTFFRNKDYRSAEQPIRELMNNLKTKDAIAGAGNNMFGNPRGTFEHYSPMFATILGKTGKVKEAIGLMEPVYNSRPYTSNVQLYASLLVDNGDYEKALPILEMLVEKGKSNPEMKEKLKTVYLKINKNGDANKHLRELEGKLKEAVAKDIAGKLIENPELAPDFKLKDFEGNDVSLNDFKGKVVVLDFWASWCVPCKKSFPAMQLAVNRFQNDPNVKFLFIDCFEGTHGPGFDPNAVLKEGGYTFHALDDKVDPVTKKSKVAGLYGVTSIPTKVIIDGKGYMRFKVGGLASPDADEEGAEEIAAMIMLVK